MGRRILDLLNDRAMSVSWNSPISVKLPESLREIIIWASGNIGQVEKELRNADSQFLEANRTFLIVFDALAWGETPVPETALLSALSNIGVVEFRMEWRVRNIIRVAASIKRRGWREAGPNLTTHRACLRSGYAFVSANALALGVRRIEIVRGPVMPLAPAANSRNAATAFCTA